MIDPLLVRVWPYSAEMFESLTSTHTSERHAFVRIDPKHIFDGEGTVIDSYMPQDEYYRKGQRAAFAIRRLFAVNSPFRAEIRGMKEAHTVAEYQLWTMSDWIRGSVGTHRAGRHFFSKSLEEYVEAQDEVMSGSVEAKSELGDLLFCISAMASNTRLDIDSCINDELNRALPHYAKRTSKKPLRFVQVDALVRRYPNLPLHYALTDEQMKEFFTKIPSRYVVVEDGMHQASSVMQKRLYRVLLSEALAKLNRTQLILEDEEEDPDFEQAHQDIARAFMLTLLTSSRLLQDMGITLQDVIGTNMTKIQQRIDEGKAVTRIR